MLPGLEFQNSRNNKKAETANFVRIIVLLDSVTNPRRQSSQLRKFDLITICASIVLLHLYCCLSHLPNPIVSIHLYCQSCWCLEVEKDNAHLRRVKKSF